MLLRLLKRQRPVVRLNCEPLEVRTVPSFLPPVLSPGEFSGVGDFNGDGRADLVVSDYVADNVSIRLGNGDGTFKPSGPSQSVLSITGAPAIADFDGDGKLDVLTKGSGLEVLRGNGDGTLKRPVHKSFQWLMTFESADMNSDGRRDVVATWAGGSPGSGYYVKLSTLLAQTDGSLTTSFTLTIGYNKGSSGKQDPPSSVLAGDFDGDGRQDVMTVASSSSNDAYPSRLLLGNGDGTLTIGPDVNQFVNVTITVGNLNSDRKADVIRKDASGTTSTVYLGLGNGNFTQTQSVAMAGTPVVADINRDRRPDLVSVNPSHGLVRILLGNGNGTYKPAQDFATGVNPTVFALGDFDGDGWLDVVAAGGGTLSALLNDRTW